MSTDIFPYRYSSRRALAVSQCLGECKQHVWYSKYVADRMEDGLGYVKIDGISYTWRGSWVSNATSLSQIIITPTRTIYTITAGPMTLNVTYLSPIEPGDFVRQSIPFSYVYVDAKSNDGKAHHINVYADISGEWVSGNRNAVITWNSTRVGNSIIHSASQTSQTIFTEASDQAEWGMLYHAMPSNYGTVGDMTGSDQACRSWFVTNGTLPDTHDSQNREIDQSWPVFALNVDLGSITQTQRPAMFAVGFVRDPATQYVNLGGNVRNRSLYFESRYSNVGQMIDDFLTDFPDAQKRAEELDNRILGQANTFGTEYADLVSLAARQVYGTTELNIAQDASGTWNQSDVMMFMKSIGDSNPRRTNPVETLYAAFPMFMYIDPTLGAPLLEPLFRFQGSNLYQNPYAAQDAGAKFPVGQGSATAHTQRIEESANMIIMTYAYVRASNDTKYARNHYPLLYGWANYLDSQVETTETSELNADQESGNQPNLEFKGIVALQAMSLLSSAVGNVDHANHFYNSSHTHAQNWYDKALNPSNGQMLATFGQGDSWSIGYNLFADVWLKTGIANSTILSAQSALYDSLLNNQQNAFGMPIDSTNPQNGAASSSWNMFAAAIAQNSTAKNIISRLRSYASLNSTTGVFATLAAQGAMFAPLALQFSASSAAHTNAKPTTTHHVSPVGAIVGAVIGGLAFLGAIAFGVWWFLKRRQRQRARSRRISLDPDDFPHDLAAASEITPFSPYEMVQHGQQATSTNSASFIMVGPASQVGSGLDSSTQLARRSEEPLIGAATSMSTSTAPMSRKRAETLQAMQAMREMSQQARAPASPGVSHSTHVGASADGHPQNDAAWALAGEVEHLRREMEALRAERETAQLPPPSYDEIRRAAADSH
ncbi:hypothetical protein EVG20_g4614 [Dentipellis fragilis]|uniref:DUF1793-domain-containing protein n=1 Tax=Dentipellis fragilis TaxID=205917 RepID=A0A4Y9YY33_9AGAM|nr:hypothetical protein EVG20_g4614 [Dentipellis fragilis]